LQQPVGNLPPEDRSPVVKRTARRVPVASESPTGDHDDAVPGRDFAPMDVALGRIIREAVMARIRHRALLEMLLAGEGSWDAYREKYTTLRERDYRPLLAQVVLTREDFERSYSQWLADDHERYGTDLESTGPLRRPNKDM